MAEHTPREIILDILMRVTTDGEMCHDAIRNALDTNRSLSARDRAFIKAAAAGTIERQIELDFIIDQFAKIGTAQMKPVIRNILRSALYQMRYMDSVPVSAACNEAVKLAQRTGFYNLKGFVNGVLRSIDRNQDTIRWPDPANRMEWLSVRYSMPRWIVKRWSDDFGQDLTERILAAFLETRPLTVRMPEDAQERGAALASLARQGVKASPAPYLPYAYYLENTGDITGLAAFRSGAIYPMDIASMFVAEAASPRVGDNILDLCAAPGGKCLHAADKMHDFGMVEARDVSEAKIAKIRENLARRDRINVHVRVGDATVFDPSLEGKMDIVLADVPCSGLGVLRRKPDVKYRVSLDSIEELVLLQRSILDNAASYVAPGGVLIYSTCTIGHAENEDNVRYLMENYSFEPEDLTPYLPASLNADTLENGYVQLLPGVQDTDGFFIARLRRPLP